jgi:hypothetical protein
MKALLCGEGPHEIGQRQWSAKTHEWVASRGWMQEVVDLVAGQPLELDGKIRRDLAILPREERRFKPLPMGHGAKALASALLAQSVGAEISVFMADADSSDPARTEQIRGEIQAGFEAANEAGIAVKGIACVTMSTSESWLLADANSWFEVAGVSPGLPKDPELIWGGRSDPDGDHPKHYFYRAALEAGLDDSADTRNRLAAAVTIATVVKKCPHSFAPFVAELAAETATV